MPATILTDSLSAIAALQSPNKGPKSALIVQLLTSLDKLVTMPTLAWIPGHAGIKGNETADRLAEKRASKKYDVADKLGAEDKIDKAEKFDTAEKSDGGAEKLDAVNKNGVTELVILHELKDELRLIDQHALERWQAEYDSQPKGAAYRSIEPIVSVKAKFTAASRSKKTLISRLRLGKCRLNHYPHEINAHVDGLCPACQTHQETIGHFLIECTVNVIIMVFQKIMLFLTPLFMVRIMNIGLHYTSLFKLKGSWSA